MDYSEYNLYPRHLSVLWGNNQTNATNDCYKTSYRRNGEGEKPTGKVNGTFYYKDKNGEYHEITEVKFINDIRDLEQEKANYEAWEENDYCSYGERKE